MAVPSPVRQPKQARSREAWERVLQVGRELIEEGGVAALTITEVCRRSGINPPSLYARVDGKAGLFAAVYEHGMADVHATEDQAFAGLPRPDTSVATQAAEAANAAAEVFARHQDFLRPVIAQAGAEPALLRRGSAESRRLLDRIAAAIDVEATVGEEVARAVYADCVLRTMYGTRFFDGNEETEPAFRARIGRAAGARAIFERRAEPLVSGAGSGGR